MQLNTKRCNRVADLLATIIVILLVVCVGLGFETLRARAALEKKVLELEQSEESNQLIWTAYEDLGLQLKDTALIIESMRLDYQHCKDGTKKPESQNPDLNRDTSNNNEGVVEFRRYEIY